MKPTPCYNVATTTTPQGVVRTGYLSKTDSWDCPISPICPYFSSSANLSLFEAGQRVRLESEAEDIPVFDVW